ncbi:bifunctional UDP-N-acetylglucosamine diphosphorylase/glucosamine-1-phosphate N-acetyltransferase GlmU [Campylobacter sp. MIT 21-1685]|uniref:bifunctional UDP-N-acetylglucosamine diphosphorylase/glucosamine-1-phosphate N-acetyltransferase GlmU n=1 Tax=unclassified Campylobacter TaxID=2593542 RepID=UPI00224A8D45|nr:MULTISPECIES: bifunctional UDP-N-acetylglucosamine diphosphorylase/glucosamine-1-phosphate N-acetyltransferase GlmU [unclassified Campylobacter]MCX2682778.1 bifunctional UDP-N-acetylglucosamine diphosphorylase/glucosamine-1-phosphate N-acetyltransferase GlmU [Campylobacter sp. MIT 21-1684]MCX2751076.1 bifunctional UDP-N-acetylglucosamine diphosphorylase/glucosamine-1-phosphate N-acetyltransferase GlmU [Campylobacter sp. MIT 21-1682]MCX2807259.1 bifunctional UDP-N-acetylglucosamine diphosphory
MKTSIIILAAGLGTRMKSEKPKVLQELCQKSMILHILEKAFSLSNDVTVAVSHQKEKIKEEICKYFPQTRFVEQDLIHFPGTAGALRNYQALNEKVLILCGDMPLVELSSLKKLLTSDSPLNVAVFQTNEPKNYGRVILEGENVKKIIEAKDANAMQKQITLCNAGVYVLTRTVLAENLPLITQNNTTSEYYLTDIIELVGKKRLKVKAVFVDENEFMGINDKFELSKAENFLQEKLKKYWSEQGVIFHLPHTSFISCDVEFIGECEVYENVRIEGKSTIINSIIKSSSVIENSFVEDSDIGPLAHLRPGCELRKTHIGNFVECKKAKLTGVKAGHLSYLGDCEIGEGTNIGCGCITCNYDGIKKHKTVIGKNVFVGSDVQFIAPVNIANRCVIAAGSTVTCDVAEGSLFINRAEKKIISNYFDKKFKK